MLFLQYLQNNNGKIHLDVIDKPDKVYKSFADPLKFGLEHEQYVTSLINSIYAAAYEKKDFRTMQFLDWFVKEQGEEETNAENLIRKFELFGADSKGLYMLDSELAARVYSPPSLVL
jgi:ferritin